MHPEISGTATIPKGKTLIFLTGDPDKLPLSHFTPEEVAYIRKAVRDQQREMIVINRLGRFLVVQVTNDEKEPYRRWEKCRKAGDSVAAFLNDQKQEEAFVVDVSHREAETLSFAEGMCLGSYQFRKYKGSREKENTLKRIFIHSRKVRTENILFLSVMTDAVARCRTLVNEPNSYLTASVFAREVQKMGKESGASVEVLTKKKIESLKMGGLLAVNQASNEPPTFTIMEWKGPKPVNKKPVVLVGKGIVFDTGGANLKPGDSMTAMKDDMSGAAAVAATVYALAKLKFPVHVIGLMPATDNKIGSRALLPGDVIRMHNGMTVEVINTDAEGRLILADALSYAKKYRPGLVIDLATLTGAAVRAIGKFGIVAMQSKAEKEIERLKESGRAAYERLAEFPSWDEYGELIRSDIADLKNLGPAEAGAITAGKFLEKFTDYPFIHLDIAGPAYLDKRDSYRGQGGTGSGVRLLLHFFQNLDS